MALLPPLIERGFNIHMAWFEELQVPSSASEFTAVLLDQSADPLPQSESPPPAWPATGSRVSIRFGAAGFTVCGGAEGECQSIWLLPSTHVTDLASGTAQEVEEGDDDDGCCHSVRVAGGFPTRSVSLEFCSAEAARSFEQKVSATTLSVVHAMHAAVAADRVGESPEEPTFSPVPGTEAMGGRRGRHPLVAGGYVLASLMPDREHRLVKATEVHGVRFGVRWLELRGSPGSGDAEFQTYLHHGPDAALVEDVPWEEQGIECPGTELFGHVLSFRQPERRGGSASAKEVAKVRCIAFRSSLEAEAWVDMAAGTRHGDAQVVDAARSRLLQSTQQRQSAVSSAGSGDELGMQWCFLRDDQDIRTRVSMEPDDLAKHYIAKNKKFNEEVQRLVVQCGNQDLRGQLESSNTCQIISTNTCEVLP